MRFLRMAAFWKRMSCLENIQEGLVCPNDLPTTVEDHDHVWHGIQSVCQ